MMYHFKAWEIWFEYLISDKNDEKFIFIEGKISFLLILISGKTQYKKSLLVM